MFFTTSISWANIVHQELNKPYMNELKERLRQERDKGKRILPSPEYCFRAMDLTNLWNVKAVIIGQDPYHTEGRPTGLAFANPYATDKDEWSPQLRNIARALKVDTGEQLTNPDLTHWATSGVLLLNRVLTVESGKPLSHQGWGWERFTNTLLKAIIDAGRPVIWVLWGRTAQEGVLPILNQNKAFEKGHELLVSSHPSPTSAHKGFLFSKPFSKINQFCYNMGYSQIAWGERKMSYGQQDHRY